jgi:two-component system KDP operon response regulator KdpE
MNSTVLVVDDEEGIHRFLRPALTASGFNVLTALTGQQAVQLLATFAPDLMLLDLGLPDMDGKEVIRQIRHFSQTPIIVLSARGDKKEKIAALDLGANDYVEKPFDIEELLARIRVAFRLNQKIKEIPTRFVIDDLVIDLAKRNVYRGDVSIHLTPTEYSLLLVLARNPGRVVTHRQIFAAVWGTSRRADAQSLRVFVGQLRAKIEKNAANPQIIATEPRVGYCLRTED